MAEGSVEENYVLKLVDRGEPTRPYTELHEADRQLQSDSRVALLVHSKLYKSAKICLTLLSHALQHGTANSSLSFCGEKILPITHSPTPLYSLISHISIDDACYGKRACFA
jgi:hypothetical protein